MTQQGRTRPRPPDVLSYLAESSARIKEIAANELSTAVFQHLAKMIEAEIRALRWKAASSKRERDTSKGRRTGPRKRAAPSRKLQQEA